MGHAGAADGFNQSFLNDAVLDVQAQLAGTLLGCAPAHTVGIAADVLNFIGLDPFALFRDGSGTMLRTLRDRAHIVDLCGVFDHNILSFALLSEAGAICTAQTSASLRGGCAFRPSIVKLFTANFIIRG